MPETKFLWEPVPDEEASRFIADKPVVSKEIFKNLLPELKARAFTIAGVESMDVVQSVRDKIAQIPRGADWDTVKKDVLKDISPWLVTSEDVEERSKQLLAANRRAELLVRVHGFQAYAVTAYKNMAAQRDIFPWWKYQSMEDSRVRATHAALDGMILPADSEFWDEHYPPWEMGCRCQVANLLDAEVQQIKAAEASKPEAERNVIEGERLQKLVKDQTIKRLNPDKKQRENKPVVDVELSPKTKSYRFNPEMLQMPMSVIKERYDKETFAKFETWAKGTKFDDKRSVWDWLDRQKPEATPAPTPEPAPSAPVQKPVTAALPPKPNSTTVAKPADPSQPTPGSGATPQPQPQPKQVAHPTTSGYVADGKPLSKAVDLAPRMVKTAKAEAQRTLALIDQVHGDGVLPPLPVGTNMKKAPKSLGVYDSGLYTMNFKKDNPHAALTIAHEVGHWVDHKAIASVGRMASEEADNPQSPLHDWWLEVQASQAYQTLNAYVPRSQIWVGHKEYLMRKREIFARSYAQFIAEESGDPAMVARMQEIATGNAPNNPAFKQWTTTDFAPIRDALRELFTQLGWMKPNNAP